MNLGDLNKGREIKALKKKPKEEKARKILEKVANQKERRCFSSSSMLHELCHNAHGPHNASFYKFWDELRKECEELMSKVITGTGQGFDVPIKRLGGFSRQPPLSSLRATAAKAAEKRVRAGKLLPSGPQRLGGDSSIMSDLTPVQAAAMAAERRFLDDIWCGSQSAEALEDKENDSAVRETTSTSLNARSVKRSSSCSNASSLSSSH